MFKTNFIFDWSNFILNYLITYDFFVIVILFIFFTFSVIFYFFRKFFKKYFRQQKKDFKKILIVVVSLYKVYDRYVFLMLLKHFLDKLQTHLTFGDFMRQVLNTQMGSWVLLIISKAFLVFSKQYFCNWFDSFEKADYFYNQFFLFWNICFFNLTFWLLYHNFLFPFDSSLIQYYEKQRSKKIKNLKIVVNERIIAKLSYRFKKLSKYHQCILLRKKYKIVNKVFKKQENSNANLNVNIHSHLSNLLKCYHPDDLNSNDIKFDSKKNKQDRLDLHAKQCAEGKNDPVYYALHTLKEKKKLKEQRIREEILYNIELLITFVETEMKIQPHDEIRQQVVDKVVFDHCAKVEKWIIAEKKEIDLINQEIKKIIQESFKNNKK